jgi:hypothetical protein
VSGSRNEPSGRARKDTVLATFSKHSLLCIINQRIIAVHLHRRRADALRRHRGQGPHRRARARFPVRGGAGAEQGVPVRRTGSPTVAPRRSATSSSAGAGAGPAMPSALPRRTARRGRRRAAAAAASKFYLSTERRRFGGAGWRFGARCSIPSRSSIDGGAAPFRAQRRCTGRELWARGGGGDCRTGWEVVLGGGCARRRGLRGGAGTAGAGRGLQAQWEAVLGGDRARRRGLRGGPGTEGAGRGLRPQWRGECGRRNCGTAGRLCSAAEIAGRLHAGLGAMAERGLCTPTVLTYRVVEIWYNQSKLIVIDLGQNPKKRQTC